ncbi:MAG: aldo/keto reductase [Gammaproteobacteria bacterium]|nr:aldo/keto reductase [Gammaproteobacteria bacterium]
MQYKTLGVSKASVIGLGTWAIGGWMWGGTNEAAAVKAIHTAMDAGINLIDTAPVYGFGISEKIVGKAIRDRRDKVVLASKCGVVWHVEKGKHFFNSDEKHPRADAADIRAYRYLAPESIRYEVEQSLKRMGVDYIDLYQTHWQDPTTPIADTMGELLKLKQEGKIRAIGVSNAATTEMDEYRKAGSLDSDQELYNLLDRGHETDNLPYCTANNLAFLCYSPLALGLLTGKIGPERKFGEGDQRNESSRFSTQNRNKIMMMLEAFAPIAKQKSITLSQLAIAWTVRRHACTHALTGARNPAQALENAAAGDIVLSNEELAAMEAPIAALGDI